MLPFLEFFHRQIPLYGLCILIGTVLAFLLLYFMANRRGCPRDDALYAGLYGVIGAMLGAKLLYLLTVLPSVLRNVAVFIEEPTALLALISGGFVFYGGLIGGVIGVYRYCRQFKVVFWPMFDFIVIFVPLVHCFGRLGCFCAGCCYGIPYQGVFAVMFPENTLGLSGVELFPVQLLEAAVNLLLFFALLWFSRKKRRNGAVLGFYLMVYAVMRFSLEFLRGDGLRGVFCELSTSQWISLFLLLGAVYLLFFFKNRPFHKSDTNKK